MKNLILLFTFLFTAISIYAQDVQLKNGKLSIDDVHVLNYDTNLLETVFFDLDGNEVLFISTVNANATKNRGPLGIYGVNHRFAKITFTSLNIDLYKKGEKGAKYLMREMVKEGYISTSGEITAEKAQEYKDKYNDEKSIGIDREIIKKRF